MDISEEYMRSQNERITGNVQPRSQILEQLPLPTVCPRCGGRRGRAENEEVERRAASSTSINGLVSFEGDTLGPPPSTGGGGQWAGRPSQPTTIFDALSFVKMAKERFADRKERYDSFLELLNAVKQELVGIEELIENVCYIFDDNLDLLVRFNKFLPGGFGIFVLEDTYGRINVSVKSPSGSKNIFCLRPHVGYRLTLD